MKISAKKVLALLFISGFVVGAVPASAFTKIAKGSEGAMGRASVNDLASEDVAILPGNPFHFVIGLRSNIKGFFISDKLDEANFKLEVAGRRAGEVRKLLDWASDNAELVSLSLANYSNALTDFERKLQLVGRDDLGADADAKLNRMVERLLTQLRFVDDIYPFFSESDDLAMLEVIDNSLASSFRFVGTQLDEAELFGGRIANLIVSDSDAATAIRVIHVLADLIQEVAGVREAESFIAAIAAAREALIADLARAIQQETGISVAKMSSSIATFAAPAPEVPESITVSEIVEQLADETLKAEIAALLQ